MNDVQHLIAGRGPSVASHRHIRLHNEEINDWRIAFYGAIRYVFSHTIDAIRHSDF
jgi:hypothetical protein